MNTEKYQARSLVAFWFDVRLSAQKRRNFALKVLERRYWEVGKIEMKTLPFCPPLVYFSDAGINSNSCVSGNELCKMRKFPYTIKSVGANHWIGEKYL